MLDFVKGQNIFEMGAEAIVNTVNCVGIMGKGLALQFKKEYPKNYKEYEAACKHGDVVPGKMFIHHTSSLLNPKYIINFPTKRHWKGKSKIEDIEAGLQNLAQEIQSLSIQSIVVPPLGCGNGGLDWAEVRPLIERYLSQLPDVDIKVIEPAHDISALKPESKKPNLTSVRALLILAINDYVLPGYELTLLEIQKLAYFLTLLGAPTNLKFQKGFYGPYDDKLNKVLEIIEGTYIQGFTGDRSPTAEIKLLSNAVEEAKAFLKTQETDYTELLKKLSDIIQGFEDPYGMEILSTVHFAVSESPDILDIPEEVVKATQWNPRKQKMLQDKHILKTLNHLKSLALV